MGKKHPHHGKSMSTNFPGSPDAMGFAAFPWMGKAWKLSFHAIFIDYSKDVH